MFAGKLAATIPVLAPKNPTYAFAQDLPTMPTASMVCMAFSLELYLKCLIRMERKTYGKEHDLKELFGKLGRRNRGKIKRHFRQNCATVRSYVERTYETDGKPVPKVDFDFVLSASKDAFTEMRYIFERGSATDTGWLGDTIIKGVRSVILAKHPEWERARQASLLPELSFPSTSQTH